MVDVTSYLKTLVPKGQRSSLKPFEKEIIALRQNGCSLQQIVDFLAANGQATTIGNVSKFIKKVTAVKEATAANLTNEVPATPVQASSSAPTNDERNKPTKEESNQQNNTKHQNSAGTLKDLKAITRGTVDPTQFLDD